jgi:hypothetical protein
MSRLIDSFWRAAAYCLHPRVIALSFLPLIIMTVASLGLGYLYWNDAVDMLRTQLDSYQLVSSMSQWLEGLGLGNLRLVLAPAWQRFQPISGLSPNGVLGDARTSTAAKGEALLEACAQALAERLAAKEEQG